MQISANGLIYNISHGNPRNNFRIPTSFTSYRIVMFRKVSCMVTIGHYARNRWFLIW